MVGDEQVRWSERSELYIVLYDERNPVFVASLIAAVAASLLLSFAPPALTFLCLLLVPFPSVLRTFSEGLPERPEPPVKKGRAGGAVVSLELSVVNGVVLVGAKVIVETGMAGGWSEGEMEEQEVEDKRRKPRQINAWDQCVAVIVQMLDRVHSQTREGLRVCIAVVKGVNQTVKGADMEEAVRRIKMEVAPDRD